MAWCMVGKPVVTKVTKALAAKFATMEPAPGDRGLRDWRRKSLSEIFVGGSFRTSEWASAFCAEDGKTYRVNGKHTSSVLNEMAEAGSLPDDLHVIVVCVHCDTLADVSRAYATFDTRDSIRNVTDINQAFAGTIPELGGIPSRMINLAVTGASIATWGLSYTSRHSEVRANLLHTNTDYAVWMYATMGGKSAENAHMHRAGVAGAMAMTYAKAKKDASEFWLAVKDGSGMLHTSPDRLLHKFLITSRVKSGTARVRSGRASAGVIATDQRGVLARSLTAWNAYRTNTTTDLKYFPNAKLPAAK